MQKKGRKKRGRSRKEWRWNKKWDEALVLIVPISRSHVIISPAFCSSAKPPPAPRLLFFIPSPTFPSLLSLPAIYLNCTHSASTHWQHWGRNWFGDLRMPKTRNACSLESEGMCQWKKSGGVNECFSSTQHPDTRYYFHIQTPNNFSLL